jgi:hypothetical protein
MLALRWFVRWLLPQPAALPEGERDDEDDECSETFVDGEGDWDDSLWEAERFYADEEDDFVEELDAAFVGAEFDLL